MLSCFVELAWELSVEDEAESLGGRFVELGWEAYASEAYCGEIL